MKKKQYQFKTNNGNHITLQQLEEQISINSLHASQSHLQICDYISEIVLRRTSLPDINKKALGNFLYFKSFEVYVLSIVIFYNERNSDKIRSICMGTFNKISASFLRDHDILVDEGCITNSAENFIDLRVKNLLLKVVIHRLYYLIYCLFFYSRRSSTKVIRSWVEVSYTLFNLHYSTSTVLVYPFGLSVKRQMRYFKLLNEKKFNYKIIGLRYSFWKFLKVVFAKRKRDFNYLDLEVSAYKHHARVLSRLKPKQMFTTDEFEAAGLILNSSLIENGVEVINKAHGIGMYCRYLCYSVFEVYNKEQIRYYKPTSPMIDYVLNKNIKAPMAPPPNQDLLNKAIVYVHSNVEDIGMKCEIKIQNQILEDLKKFTSIKGLPLILKIHPNTSDEKVEVLMKKGFACEKDINQIIRKYRPVFITIISTAYYDYRLLGDFYFYKDRYNDASVYFGSAIKLFQPDTLCEVLEKNIDERGTTK